MLTRRIIILYVTIHVFSVAVVSIFRQVDDKWQVRELGRSRETSTHPSHILLSVSCKSVKVVLNLVQSQHNKENIPVLLGRHRKIVAWIAKPTQRYAVYQDKDNEAYVLRAAHGKTKLIYQGSFRRGETEYVLKPFVISQQHGSRLRRRRQVTTYNASSIVQTVTERVLPGPLVYSATQLNPYVVDVFMAIDCNIYQSWYDVSLEETPVAKMNDAINSMRYYYAQVANGMDLRYSSVQQNNFGINIRLAGLYIATTSSDSEFTEAANVKKVINGVGYTNATRALSEIINWSQNITLPRHDQITVFTGNVLMSNFDNQGRPVGISGLSFIGAICTVRSVAVCKEWSYYSSVGTASHELAHSLGSIHDGSNNTCSTADQYIMATSASELNASIFLHPFSFSNCSIASMRSLLESMNAQSNCLLNKTFTPSSSSGVIGQYMSLDKQCQLLYGANSFYCGGAINDAVMCKKMLCFNEDTQSCAYRTEQRAADYTSCGDKQWCYQGSCVFDAAAPTIHRRCLSGDSKAPMSANGTTCETLINSHPGLCYEEYYNMTCCSSCEKFADIGSPDCLYGDRNTPNYCSSITSADCYDKNAAESCCATCKQYRMSLNIPGCQYGDLATWCSTQNMAACYSNSTETTCCATCYYFLQSGSPGCKYGDKQAWCKDYTSSTCSQDPNANETCCRTCGLEVNAQINSDCKDVYSYCSSIVASDCYKLSQKCCRTCSKYIINVPECMYGDRYGWCNKTVEPEYCKQDSNVLEDCCDTCYRLRGVTRKPKSQGSSSKPNGLLGPMFIVYTVVNLLMKI